MTFTAGGSQGRPLFFSYLTLSIMKRGPHHPNRVREQTMKPIRLIAI